MSRKELLDWGKEHNYPGLVIFSKETGTQLLRHGEEHWRLFAACPNNQEQFERVVSRIWQWEMIVARAKEEALERSA